MRVDPQLAREAARLAAAMLAARGVAARAFELPAGPHRTAPPVVGSARVAIPPELLGLDLGDIVAGADGHALYARAAGAHVRYEGPVRPVDIRV